jgi:dipeptidyl aminopeptidase/acylaminoacyl peptidase
MVAALAAGASIGGASAQAGPNGLIAYSSWDDSGNYDTYLVDPADSAAPPVKLTTDGKYNANPSWSPDGRKIAYDGWGDSGGPRIRIMDIDPATEDSAIITEPCPPEVGCYGDFQPAWSPDGTRIAFVSSRPNADGSEAWGYQLYVMDATGEVGDLPRATRLTTDVPDDSGKMIANSQATWSPDGRRIAFLSTGRGDDADSCDLWVMDSQDTDGDGFGDNLRRLTFDESFNCDAFEDVNPKWSPNSSLIAFTSVRSGYFDIWLVNADNPADLRNVTQTPERYEDQPNWSPDGTRIIYRSTAAGAYELFSLPVPPPATESAGRATAAVAGPTPQRLTFDRRRKRQADWGRPAAARPGTMILRVSKSGGGRVVSAPNGLSCGRDCVATFVRGQVVQLTARPAAGYSFAGWGGACAEELARICSVRLGRSKSVTARFE